MPTPVIRLAGARMKLKILGCSGGIGVDARTTSMLLDDDILIDAGTGVGDLGAEELYKINHVFVTHSHLDHIAAIPFLIDGVGYLRPDRPLTIHAMEATLDVLRRNIFNWEIWPDFTRIPDATKPYMRYESLSVGTTVCLDGRRITPLPANHTVPAVGFQLDSGNASLVFSGDTAANDALWEIVNRIDNLKYLIMETAFSNKERWIALRSKHLCPSMLAEELEKLERKAEIYITHLKPGDASVISREIQECAGRFNPKPLVNNQVFEF